MIFINGTQSISKSYFINLTPFVHLYGKLWNWLTINRRTKTQIKLIPYNKNVVDYFTFHQYFLLFCVYYGQLTHCRTFVLKSYKHNIFFIALNVITLEMSHFVADVSLPFIESNCLWWQLFLLPFDIWYKNFEMLSGFQYFRNVYVKKVSLLFNKKGCIKHTIHHFYFMFIFGEK